jgi:peptidoglycan L-alanyl-D-glutamate endopeptidase CwlK
MFRRENSVENTWLFFCLWAIKKSIRREYYLKEKNMFTITHDSPKKHSFFPAFEQQSKNSLLFSTLSQTEKEELIKLLHELFKGYSFAIKDITLDKVILKNGQTFDWLPPKGRRTEMDVLNAPSLIEQFLPVYIPGKEWQSHPDHDGHAGRFRELNFFKAIFGSSEKEVQEKLIPIKWLEKSFENKTISVSSALDINKVFQKLSAALDSLDTLSETKKFKFLEEISGTFNWRVIAGTERLSAHSFGMTLDLNCNYCEYWLWDYQKEHAASVDEKMLTEENILAKELPEWRNRVPFEIVDIFEKHGFIWGGKWRKYDTMHFEYRPEFFVDIKVKQRLRQLLEKEGYQLLPPLLNTQLALTAKPSPLVMGCYI